MDIISNKMAKKHRNLVIGSVLMLNMMPAMSQAAGLLPLVYCNQSPAAISQLECPHKDSITGQNACITGTYGEVSNHLAGDSMPCGGLLNFDKIMSEQTTFNNLVTVSNGIPLAKNSPSALVAFAQALGLGQATALPAALAALYNINPATGATLPTVITNDQLNQPGSCLAGNATTLPAFPCGAAIPVTNQLTQLNAMTWVGPLLNIGNTISVATPSPLNPPSSITTINNSTATGNCAPSIFQVPNNALYVTIPTTTDTTALSPANVTYNTSQSKLQLPGITAFQFDLTKPGLIQFPTATEITDPNGNPLYLPAGTFALSYGNGTLVLPVTGPIGSVGSTASNVQQSLPIPGDVGIANQMATDLTTILPAGSIRINSQQDPTIATQGTDLSVQGSTATTTSAMVVSSSGAYPQVVGLTLNYTGSQQLVVDSDSVNIWNIDSSGAVRSLSGSATLVTNNMVAPANASLVIPGGTPISISLTQPGTITLPAGGTITVPVGGAMNGVAIPTTSSDQYASVAQNVTVTSDGRGNLTFNDQTLSFPAGTNNATIFASMIALPQGAVIPTGANQSVIMPQSPGQNAPASACGTTAASAAIN